MIRAVAGLLFALVTWPASGAPAVSVAAAANLLHALEALNAAFQRAEPGIALTSTTGASGSLYAQIRNGAPFDVFLSADTEYPQQLVAAGAGDAASLRIFATGRLVLWTTRPDLELADSAALIRHASVKKIALAQPKTAPYGRAAQAVLERLGVWREAQPKLVLGENISQTAQFVETGNADVGFVALAIVRSSRLAATGRWQEITPDQHPGVSLDHAGVLTRRGATNPAARRYLDFLATAPARKILEQFGYTVRAQP
jgi:molybdate transport system substrate-binding protein